MALSIFINLPVAHREAKDPGVMYGHGFEDLDSHIWELVHMPARQGEAACQT